MDSSVVAIAVYRNFNPSRSGDEKLWDPKDGILVEKKVKKGKRKTYQKGNEIFHGMDAWAVIPGKDERQLVRFDDPMDDFVFPEIFCRRARIRKANAALTRKARKAEIDAAWRAVHPAIAVQ